MTRRQIGWIHWSRTEYGQIPVYEGDFDDFDPDEDEPDEQEMEERVDDVGPIGTVDSDYRWQAIPTEPS